VILATDGLWDYLSDQEAVDIVAACLNDADAARRLQQKLPHAKHSSGSSHSDSDSDAASSSSGGGGGGGGGSSVSSPETDAIKWELLAAERLINRALEIAAEESGMTLVQLKTLSQGRARRGNHDDTTAVVMFF
jgi:hypothetical protein